MTAMLTFDLDGTLAPDRPDRHDGARGHASNSQMERLRPSEKRT